ncbi:MAG: 2-phosphosulfolactate phosphatase [Planctomycetales bacterium]|nr:2-phosphosulfolactate phosphatase [Planctomycetales bacterium]
MRPKCFVYLLPEYFCPPSNPFAAVVIDTFRFTTTATKALASGAASVLVAKDIEQAHCLYEVLGKPRPLLCGERHCNKIEGFDLGNSPLEFTKDQVAQRTLIFTTTNGTRAVQACANADSIFLGCLRNRSSLCQLLNLENDLDIHIVCAGTDGNIALEDSITAGAIVKQLVSQYEIGSDATNLSLQAWLAISSTLESGDAFHIPLPLLQAQGGHNLVAQGYERDIEYAIELDVEPAVAKLSANSPAPSFTLSRVA